MLFYVILVGEMPITVIRKLKAPRPWCSYLKQDPGHLACLPVGMVLGVAIFLKSQGGARDRCIGGILIGNFVRHEKFCRLALLIGCIAFLPFSLNKNKI